MPAWSPDGRSIAFTSDRTGDFEVFVVPAAGGEPQNLSRNPGRGRRLDLARLVARRVVDPVPVRGQRPVVAGAIRQAGVRGGRDPHHRRPARRGRALRPATLRPAVRLVHRAAGGAGGAGHGPQRRVPVHPGCRRRPDCWPTSHPAPGRLDGAGSATPWSRFLAPALFFAAYFVAVALTTGIGWSIHLWLGAIAIAGIIGRPGRRARPGPGAPRSSIGRGRDGGPGIVLGPEP